MTIKIGKLRKIKRQCLFKGAYSLEDRVVQLMERMYRKINIPFSLLSTPKTVPKEIPVDIHK